jgi:hypothetical protein
MVDIVQDYVVHKAVDLGQMVDRLGIDLGRDLEINKKILVNKLLKSPSS